MVDSQALCALDGIPARSGGYVVTIRGGRSVVSRLAALGFLPGARTIMVQNYGRGPLIVELRQTRIALGRGEARCIVVQRAGAPMENAA